MAKWKLVSKHEFDPASFLAAYRYNWFGFPIFLAAGAAFFLLPARQEDRPYMWLFGALATSAGVFAVGWPVGRWVRRVRTAKAYDQGLRWKQGRTEFEYPWEQAVEVSWNDVDVRVNNEPSSAGTRITDLRVAFADRRVVHFSHVLTDYGRLASFVQQATAERLYAKAWADLVGEGAAFGKLLLTQDGLRVGSRATPWTGVKWATLEKRQPPDPLLEGEAGRGPVEPHPELFRPDRVAPEVGQVAKLTG
jgi:hypothetical protein